MLRKLRKKIDKLSAQFHVAKDRRSSRLVVESLEGRINPGSLTAFDTSAQAPPPPQAVTANALVLPSGQVVPLIPTPNSALTEAIGFFQSNATVTAYNQDGIVLWSKVLGAGQLFGGFDFDGDGIPDLGIVRVTPTGGWWGSGPIDMTSLLFYHGADGTFAGSTDPMEDQLWTFGNVAYPTQQWATDTVIFGSGQTMLVGPQYSTTSWFLQGVGQSLATVGALDYPSTAAYDLEYTQAQPNPFDGSTDYIAHSEVANGLIVNTAAGPVAVFWTTARVVQYSVGPLGSNQLISDDPYLNGGRSDLAGRAYGLVAQDPNDPDDLSLLAGTSAMALYTDAVTGKIAYDPLGGIERHVDIYSVSGDAPLQQLFYSYAHDDGNAYLYNGRVAFPADPYLRVAPGTPSRLAYNVFSDGEWCLHISQPGSVNDAVIIPDVYLWDIVDLGNGRDELITSPTRGSAPYFPQWKTVCYTWNDATLSLNTKLAINGGIPYITEHFRTPTTSSSQGYLFPVNVAMVDGRPSLILTSPQGQQFLTNMNQVTPVVRWAQPAAIPFGTVLGSVQLDAATGVPGVFVYTPGAGAVLPVGAHQALTVTFTPTDAVDYATVTATVYINVTRSAPTISWTELAAIVFGTRLGPAQLDATAALAGRFLYSPAPGTLLQAGSHILSVTFRPADTHDYRTVQAHMWLQVVRGTPAFSSLESLTTNLGASSTSLTGKLGFDAPVPTGVVTVTVIDGNSRIEASAPLKANGSFRTTLASGKLGFGSYTVSYSYKGNANFDAAHDATTTLQVGYILDVQSGTKRTS
jgi:hypothetical protein